MSKSSLLLYRESKNIVRNPMVDFRKELSTVKPILKSEVDVAYH